MIYTTEVLQIEDAALKLVQAIVATKDCQNYQAAHVAVAKSETAQAQQAAFLDAKRAFDKIEEYGSHALEYKARQRALRLAKRQLDVVSEVAQLRLAETSLQVTLDVVSESVASFISKDIIVEYGNAFFQTKKHQHHAGCAGGCQKIG